MDYVEAMEYGMPPCAGFGISERLFAVLMDQIHPRMRDLPAHERSQNRTSHWPSDKKIIYEAIDCYFQPGQNSRDYQAFCNNMDIEALSLKDLGLSEEFEEKYNSF